MKISTMTKGILLTGILAFALLFAAAVSTSECAAVNDETTITIHCGTGHANTAAALAAQMDGLATSELNYDSIDASSSGTDIIVTCNSSVKVNSMKDVISACLRDKNHSSTFENNELLWSPYIGLYTITNYHNYGDLLTELKTYQDATVSNQKNFYLLWLKPFDQAFSITIDTPKCGSTEFPSVTSETVPLADNYATTIDDFPPKWFASKPEGTEQSMSSYIFETKYYKEALKGGTSYYACVQLDPPWGYYFPTSFPQPARGNVTVNGQPADVMDAAGVDARQYLFVGAYVTAEHVWGDQWTLTQEPTCSAEGIESRPCTMGCGTFDTRPVAIDPSAHSWGAWKTVKKPTALNAGQEQRVCEHDASHIEKRTLPATGVSGTLLAQMKSSGTTKLKLTWTKVKGAEGYDVFFAKCNTNESKTKLKRVKTIKGNSTFAWAKSGLKKKTAYKAQVKAFANKSGKKTYVKTSPAVHVFTSGGSAKYTNPKSVSVNKTTVVMKTGRTFQIKGKVIKLSAKKKLIPKAHGPVLRYCSSNKAVATVSSAGKITAKKAGKCTVYVLAVNGVRKSIAVTVK